MLTRRNVMIDSELWKCLGSLSDIREKSISQILNEVAAEYIKKEQTQNLTFKVRLISENNKHAISKEEEHEILSELVAMTSEDREIVEEETL